MLSILAKIYNDRASRCARLLPLLLVTAFFAINGAGCNVGIGKTSTTSDTTQPKAPGTLSPDDVAFHGVGFVDATAESGIDFVHSTGQQGAIANLLESNGGGVGLLDYDGDGNMDVYFVSGVPKPPITGGTPPSFVPHNHLYHNNGNGTFTDVTDKSGTAVNRYCSCVAVGDYLNNGRPDIFVGTVNGPNVLLRNNGDGTFTDVAKEAGVADMGVCLGATWLDYDNDGKLDLYVSNYVKYDPNYKYFYNPDGYPGPLSYDAVVGKLYHNDGNGHFTDVTHQMGLDIPGRAMGVASVDYDGSGYPSIYVANDSMPKYLFHNDGGKHFTEVGRKAGCAFNMNGEGVASMMGTFGDYGHDGRPSLFVPDDKFKSLFHNIGNGMFEDITAQTGIAAAGAEYTSWGSGWVDFENSGDPGLIICNGAFHHLYGEDVLLLRNDGGKFTDVSDTCGPFFKRKIDARGTAFGDYNNDGVEDVFINVLNDHCVVLKGQCPNGNHWLEIKLVGHKSNRDGIGAMVKLTYAGKTRYGWRVSGGAYLSENDPRLHFGLGKNTTVDRIDIKWPSGISQTLTNVTPDKIMTIDEPGQSQTGAVAQPPNG